MRMRPRMNHFRTAHVRADSRLTPSQWETSLQSNAVSHWLGAKLESVLLCHKNLKTWRPCKCQQKSSKWHHLLWVVISFVSFMLPDTYFYMLAVGVGIGDTLLPISSPEVNVTEPICLKVILGCVWCPHFYDVRVGRQIQSRLYSEMFIQINMLYRWSVWCIGPIRSFRYRW